MSTQIQALQNFNVPNELLHKIIAFVKCAKCDLSFHIKCANVAPIMYDHLKINRNISFMCQPCINSTLSFSDLEDNENIDMRDNHALPVDYETIRANLDGII